MFPQRTGLCLWDVVSFRLFVEYLVERQPPSAEVSYEFAPQKDGEKIVATANCPIRRPYLVQVWKGSLWESPPWLFVSGLQVSLVL
jgi:hypothetical protein